MDNSDFLNFDVEVDSIEQQWNATYQKLNIIQDDSDVERLINTTKAWSLITLWLDPFRFDKNEEDFKQIPIVIRDSLIIIQRTPLATRLVEWYIEPIISDDESNINDKLENKFCEDYSTIIGDIYIHFKKFEGLLLEIFTSSDTLQKFYIQYHTHLYYSLSDKFQSISIVPSLFKNLTKIFIEICFRKFDQLISLGFTNIKSIYSLSSKLPKALPGNNELFVWKKEEDGLNQKYAGIGVDDNDENNDPNSFKNELISQIVTFSSLCNKMHSLGLIQRTKDVLENTLCEQIESRVVDTCRNTFDKSMLRRTTKWLYSVLYPWLQIVITPNFLDFNISIKELFDVIVDFPESKTAISDLVICMKRLDTDYKHRLVQSLQNALLIPGASTMDIINTYMSTVKCLRLLDPSGVLLEKITIPIRNYLRKQRDDAARCLVNSWMDDKNPNFELIDELGRTEIPIENQNDDEYNLDDDDNWIPDPVDAGPEYKSSIYRLADMTNLLISLFDNTELLTEEIQRQMAECLLLKTDFNTTKELAKLELFKLRFGESKMSTVEVMVKDISDSKRINGNIYNNNERLIRKNAAESSDLEIILNNENEILYTSILSRLFWPTINNEEFEVPPPISDEMKTYNNAFQSLKPRRKLNWLPSLGKVQLELEFQGKTLEMEVEPVHATIIYHFQEKDTWKLDDLAKQMKYDPQKLKYKMEFWTDRGILGKKSKDEWVLLEMETKASSTNI
ncbi:21595_t:CDS:10 [Entrophospora sp. SA101]|nr:21595_t:CDS:10 [Entrophospora sp. SA101]